MASRQHLLELKKGAAAWNRWRSENAAIIPDLKGARLRGGALAGVNLSFAVLAEADLAAADLSEADLTGAIVFKASLKGALLNGATLRTARLEMADLAGASLVNADLTAADLKHADLTAARLGTADLRGADLSSTRLDGAGLEWANLSRTELSLASLRNASCRKTDFSSAVMEGADLRGADLRFARLTAACLAGVKVSRGGRFLGVRLDGAHGSRRFLRFAAHQDAVEEMRGAGPWGRIRYGLWLAATDCGRSLWPWLGWCLALVGFFAAGFYSFLGPEAFETGTASWNFGSVLTFSMANFAGLHAGWLKPVSAAARGWIAAEAFSGYLMLALLIAAIAGRWSRR
jgi:uncharacterized protein YjbI with pentapeptide repeats